MCAIRQLGAPVSTGSRTSSASRNLDVLSKVGVRLESLQELPIPEVSVHTMTSSMVYGFKLPVILDRDIRDTCSIICGPNHVVKKAL